MSPVIDEQKLQEIKKKLKELPKVERVRTYSGPEALAALGKEIKALTRKGYDSKEIAKILKQEGLAASAAKVKKIMTDDHNNEPEGGEPKEPAGDADPQPATGENKTPDQPTAPQVVRRPARVKPEIQKGTQQ